MKIQKNLKCQNPKGCKGKMQYDTKNDEYSCNTCLWYTNRKELEKQQQQTTLSNIYTKIPKSI